MRPVLESGHRSARSFIAGPSFRPTASGSRPLPRRALPQALPPTSPCRCGARRLLHGSSTRLARSKGHYEALSLPRNATKQQVKARFYELSKKHHPDAPGGSADKFHEINDAYSVLGDEGKRRQYDNSMTQPLRGGGMGGSSFYPHSPGSRPSAQGPHRSWNRRPPGAGAGAAGRTSPNDPFNPFARPHAYPRADPHGMPFGRTGTAGGRRPTPGGPGTKEFEGLRAEGSFWRFGIVVGLLVAVISFGGGLSVSAEELHPRPPDTPMDNRDREEDDR